MKKQFTWSAFSLPFIKSICYSEHTPKVFRPKFETNDKDSLIPFIDNLGRYPDEHFVKRYREEIIKNFFAGSTHLVSLMRALERRHYSNAQVSSMDDMLERLKKMRMTSTVVTLILAELKQEGTQFISDEEVSVFTKPKNLDLRKCVSDELPMFDYQDKAIEALNEHFITKDKSAGILCMPTGSGKTRVATSFLLKSMVANGWQIVWLAHRAMLIDQAASSIYTSSAALLPLTAPKKEKFKMVCVSGSHATIKATEADDDVMIGSVQSLVRNLPYLKAVLGEKVMLIVDEAHHALAPSYRTIIQEVRKISQKVKLLGLTATPKRLKGTDTTRLMQVFDNEVLYSVAMSDLIAKGLLSTPHYERIDTNIDFNTTITLDEKKYIAKWGELSPETLERMARLTERNKLIADTYCNDKERYGKTLIFAVNAHHCISLCEELQKRGVRCDYIYCVHKGNEEKIARFQRGELDVLVNIQVLTEGSDVPDIQTVFLTRPTQSDVLLMQMIGRGMRGSISQGTSDMNIVDFHDVWGNFTEWMNPQFIFEEVFDGDGDIETITMKKSDLVPWVMIRDILDGIKTSYVGIDAIGKDVAVPVGWYDVLDEDGNDRKVFVFSSQLSGYVKMLKNKNDILSRANYTGYEALCDWFGGFGLKPTSEDLEMVLNTMRLSDEPLHLYQIKERKEIDAYALAERLRLEDSRAKIAACISNVYEEHTQIINNLYGDYKNYEYKVKMFLEFPNGEKPLGAKVEEFEDESLTIDFTPVYDIDELTREVVAERFDNAYGKLPPISWTEHKEKGYFGKYTYDKGGDFVEISCILNSKDVPKEVVKYVIYHELLHRDYRFHDKTFRAQEHLYPNWTEHERFLDVTFPKFDLAFAM